MPPKVQSPNRPVTGGRPIGFRTTEPWYRVYHQDIYSMRPTVFRKFGPLGRFDHHEDSGAPGMSPDRGVLYLADSIATAVVEAFQVDSDGAGKNLAVCPNWRVARLSVVSLNRLLDLSGPHVMEAGTYALMCGSPRDMTQEWARAIYEDNPAGGVHGIQYRSTFDNGLCIALWERDVAVKVRQEGADEEDYPLAMLEQSNPEWYEDLHSGLILERLVGLQPGLKDDCPACQDPNRQAP